MNWGKLLTFVVIGLLAGCDGTSSNNDCSIGSEGCACTEGGVCDGTLSCLSGICVDTGANGDVASDNDATTQEDGTQSDNSSPDEGSNDDLVEGSCPSDSVQIGALPVCIDKYEASRPDASAEDDGNAAGPAQSVAGVVPYYDSTGFIAEQACADAGKRLCTAAEWTAACEGPDQTMYPYGNTFDAQACVTTENTEVVTHPNITSGLEGCEGGYPGLFDMSGNQAEMVSTVPSAGECGDFGDLCLQSMGGRYNLAASESTCTSYIVGNKEWESISVGFRCCKDL